MNHDACHAHTLATHFRCMVGGNPVLIIILFYSSGYVSAENGTFDTLLNLGGIIMSY